MKRGDGVGAVTATGTITLATAVATNVVTINGVAFTAIANGSSPTGNQWAVGAGGSADTDSATALKNAINAATSTAHVTATSALGVVTVTADSVGTSGNRTFTKSGSPVTLSPSGGALTSGTDEGYTLIAEIMDLSGPNETAKQIDVTSLDSPAREYILALRDSGELTLDLNWVGSNAQQQALRSAVGGAKGNFKMVLPDTTTITFAAVVTAFGPKFGVDKQITASATLKITGNVTYTYPA